MILLYYKVLPVYSAAGKWGVFTPDGDYLYEVFEDKEDAEKWAEEKKAEGLLIYNCKGEK